ncbi:MAG: S-layer homology domain-containing protein [Bifidobacteriaceae bacterium]|nr:S-layer homology domain-containing protein [Bifidobacteriaceae bacterium]
MKKSITIFATIGIISALISLTAAASAHSLQIANIKAEAVHEDTKIPNLVNWSKATQGQAGVYTNSYSFRWKRTSTHSDSSYGIEAWLYKGDSFSWRLAWNTPDDAWGYKIRSITSNSSCLQAKDKYAVEERKMPSGSITASVGTSNCKAGDYFALKGGQNAANGEWNETGMNLLKIDIIVYIVDKPEPPEITKYLTNKNLLASANPETDNFDFTSLLRAPFSGQTKILWSGSVDGITKTSDELENYGFSFFDNSYSFEPKRAGKYSVSATVYTDNAILNSDSANAGTYYLKSASTLSRINVSASNIASINLDPKPALDQNSIPLFDNPSHCIEEDGSLCPIYTRHLKTDENPETNIDLQIRLYDAFENSIALDDNIIFEVYLSSGEFLPADINTKTGTLNVTPDMPTGVYKILAKTLDGSIFSTKYISIQGAAKDISPSFFQAVEGTPESFRISADVYPNIENIECENSLENKGISIADGGIINLSSSTQAGDYVLQNCILQNKFISNADENLKASNPVDFSIAISEQNASISPTPPTEEDNIFQNENIIYNILDIPSASDEKEYIKKMYKEKYTNGCWQKTKKFEDGIRTIDTKYCPKNLVNRQQMAAFLYRFAKSPELSLPSISPFIDFPSNKQFFKDVIWGVNSKIWKGYDDKTFRGANPITRGQMILALYRFSGSPNVKLPKTSPFHDLSASGEIYSAVIWAKNNGITTGYQDKTFRQNDKLTRSQMAAFIIRQKH